MTKIKEKPKCEKCESGQVYTLVNGTIVCRTCGARTSTKIIHKDWKKK